MEPNNQIQPNQPQPQPYGQVQGNAPSSPVPEQAQAYAPNPPASNLPYFLQPDPAQPVQPEKPKLNIKKPLIIGGVIIACLVLAAVAVLAFVPKKSSTTTKTTNTLKTVVADNVQYAYPTAWSKIDTGSSDFSAGYSSMSGAALYYRKSSLLSKSVGVSKVPTDTRQSIRDSIVAGIQKENASSSSCTGFKLVSQTKVDQPTYFGVDVTFSCQKNARGVAVQELDRYIYVGDSYLYQVSISGTTIAWQGASGTQLNAMKQQVVPKAKV